MNLRAFYNLESIKPRDYQEEAINFLMVHKYVILADEMGLGKSLEAFYAALRSGGRTLIVCPSFLIENWKDELNKILNLPLPILIWRSEKDLSKVTSVHNIILCSYHGLKSIHNLMRTVDNVIVDEAHSFKNFTAQRTKKLHELVQKFRPRSLTLLTGTPAPNYVDEFYSLMVLCSYNKRMYEDDKITHLYPSYYSFINNFCYLSKNRYGGYNIIGTRNEKEFKNYLKNCYLRRTAKEVLDLPNLITKDILINSGEDTKLWKAFEEIKNHKLSQKLQTAKIDNAVYKTKFTFLYVNDLVKEGQVLIFTEHIKSGEALANNLNKGNISSHFISGLDDVNSRNEVIEKFKTGKLKVLISTIKVGSVGYNLVNCRNIIFNDYSYTPALNLQAIKRCHRIGQKNNVVIHNIFGTTTDKKIHNIVHRKMKMLDAVLRD